jgi:lipid-binding SYLF domain-containing protein
MLRKQLFNAFAGAMCMLALAACASTAPVSPSAREDLHLQSDAALTRFQARDPDMKVFVKEAYGYAVFPSVTKGAAGLGGAYGRGLVYEQGKFIGYTDVSQATIGPQLGGQEYSEVIFFEDKATLERFKAGHTEFAAQASAIAAKAGASSDADYENGVMVFSLGNGGLMFEASIGGQKFSYVRSESV